MLVLLSRRKWNRLGRWWGYCQISTYSGHGMLQRKKKTKERLKTDLVNDSGGGGNCRTTHWQTGQWRTIFSLTVKQDIRLLRLAHRRRLKELANWLPTSWMKRMDQGAPRIYNLFCMSTAADHQSMSFYSFLSLAFFQIFLKPAAKHLNQRNLSTHVQC